ncbi:MAG: PspA-associated protein PspAA [Nitrososphaera sp.]
MAASNLRSRRMAKRKAYHLRRLSRRKAATRLEKKPSRQPSVARTAAKSGSAGKRIVRIMGQGQYAVDSRMLKRLNHIDDAIVELVSKERSDDVEFKKRLTELIEMVVRKCRPLDPKDMIRSDIILPSTDLSVDEAKRLFKGEGVIPAV